MRAVSVWEAAVQVVSVWEAAVRAVSVWEAAVQAVSARDCDARRCGADWCSTWPVLRMLVRYSVLTVDNGG